MARDAQERDQPASPQQLRRARERGEVARSVDLSSSAVLVMGATALLHTAPSLALVVAELAHGSALAASTAADGARAWAFVVDALARVSAALAPFAAVVALVAVVVPFLQVGPLFALEPLAPKWARVDPVAGLKQRLFSLDAWSELARSLAKLAVVGLACWVAISGSWPRLNALQRANPLHAARELLDLTGALILGAGACFLALGVLDALYQRRRFARRMRMTRDERRRDDRENDGDSEQRRRRKQRHKEIALASFRVQVLRADFAVRNPTHILCALRYRPDESDAPILIAKGDDELALEMLAMAEEAGLPLVEDVPFARALFALELGSAIPEELYEAAFETLRWINALAEREGWTPAWKKPREDGATEAESPR